MTWNHRVLKRVLAGEETFAIYEVFYDELGNPTACTVDATGPLGETLDELREDMAHFAAALEKPVLEYEAIGKP